MSGTNPENANVAAFLRGMRELGYEYGKDFVDRAARRRGQDGKRTMRWQPSLCDCRQTLSSPGDQRSPL
jgi:hypothetical protein